MIQKDPWSIGRSLRLSRQQPETPIPRNKKERREEGRKVFFVLFTSYCEIQHFWRCSLEAEFHLSLRIDPSLHDSASGFSGVTQVLSGTGSVWRPWGVTVWEMGAGILWVEARLLSVHIAPGSAPGSAAAIPVQGRTTPCSWNGLQGPQHFCCFSCGDCICFEVKQEQAKGLNCLFSPKILLR